MGGNVYYKYDGLNRLTGKWTAFEDSENEPLYLYEKFVYDNAETLKRKEVQKIGRFIQ